MEPPFNPLVVAAAVARVGIPQMAEQVGLAAALAMMLPEAEAEAVLLAGQPSKITQVPVAV